MSVRDKWVRRFSIDETAKHKNGFTIYKITSVLFPLESPEAVTVVSVWKRYSDVQQLHKSMKSLHAGLHLRGTFPQLAKSSFFKRFQPEVIEERAKTIKALLEFVAEHRLLFTSTDFVNFLQTGYPEPETKPSGVINAIRSSLHLPIEETPPLEYQTSDDETRSPVVTNRTTDNTNPLQMEIDVSHIPIYVAADVEIRESPKTSQKLSESNSFESINSIDSLDSDLFDELNKVTIDKNVPSVKRNVLPDLINFDAPSTSKFEDYHTMPRNMETSSVSSTLYDDRRSETRRSMLSLSNMELGSRTSVPSLSNTDLGRSSVASLSNMDSLSRLSAPSLSNVDCATRTEDSYVFEAGYSLSMAARCEERGEYRRAFECYKAGIEKMLIGVQTDSDPQRRSLIKEKTNKYLAYAENIYKNHLCNADQSLLPEREESRIRPYGGVPLAMLRRPYEELSRYRVLAALGGAMMLVLHEGDQTCYAMKVIQKIPSNLTEFDDYFHQRTNETRQPILPTSAPYMVPLHAFVETNNLIFLILSYAPGERLFDYIKNYTKSIPNTPAREVNLENIFSEPKIDIDVQNNIESIEIDSKNDVISDVNENLDVDELVINSQKLLLNVDKALSEVPRISSNKGNTVSLEDGMREKAKKMGKAEGGKETPNSIMPQPKVVLPPSAICRWGAEILTALESLHNSGVICRDLNPSNILLGSRGHALLTYQFAYRCDDVTRAHLARKKTGPPSYAAPELRQAARGPRDATDPACDYWSFGALLYHLLCGHPLSHWHSTFSPHTILQLPEGLSVDASSLLTQLLTYSPSERLGSGKDGIDEIKQHPYFRHINWQEVYDSWIVPD